MFQNGRHTGAKTKQRYIFSVFQSVVPYFLQIGIAFKPFKCTIGNTVNNRPYIQVIITISCSSLIKACVDLKKKWMGKTLFIIQLTLDDQHTNNKRHNTGNVSSLKFEQVSVRTFLRSLFFTLRTILCS